ncbi:MAG: Crp/Fnr family transcriptional regulator [Acidimicrobiales bacterium]
MEWQLLEELRDETQASVMRMAVTNRLRADEYLWFQGDSARTVHFIESGRVAIEVASPDGFVSILTVMGPGEVVGEHSLVDTQRRRSGSVRALEDVSTFSITSAQFEELRTNYPSVDRFLVRVLASRVDRLSTQVLEAAYDDVEARVNRRLAVLTEAYRHPGEDGSVVIRITQDELARMAGSTRPSVNRHLRRLEDAGIIELGRGRVTVHRSDQLA